MDNHTGIGDEKRNDRKVSLEFAIGTGEYDQWARYDGKDLVVEDKTITFLKTGVVGKYAEYYKEMNDKSIKSTFIVLTESVYESDDLNQNICHEFYIDDKTRIAYYCINPGDINNWKIIYGDRDRGPIEILFRNKFSAKREENVVPTESYKYFLQIKAEALKKIDPKYNLYKKHCIEIEKCIDKHSKELINELSEHKLFVILSAIWWHDVGKYCSNTTNESAHNKLSAQMLQEYMNTRINNLPAIYRRLLSESIKICENHTDNISENVFEDNHCNNVDKLCLLLRIAELLETDVHFDWPQWITDAARRCWSLYHYLPNTINYVGIEEDKLLFDSSLENLEKDDKNEGLKQFISNYRIECNKGFEITLNEEAGIATLINNDQNYDLKIEDNNNKLQLSANCLILNSSCDNIYTPNVQENTTCHNPKDGLNSKMCRMCKFLISSHYYQLKKDIELGINLKIIAPIIVGVPDQFSKDELCKYIKMSKSFRNNKCLAKMDENMLIMPTDVNKILNEHECKVFSPFGDKNVVDVLSKVSGDYLLDIFLEGTNRSISNYNCTGLKFDYTNLDEINRPQNRYMHMHKSNDEELSIKYYSGQDPVGEISPESSDMLEAALYISLDLWQKDKQEIEKIDNNMNSIKDMLNVKEGVKDWGWG